jgi:ankyrin repeat protein
LLDLGADINARDQDGATCLHYAIHRGSTRTLKKLLLRGADKNIKKFDGKTAYDLAIENNQIEIAKILQTKGFLRKYLCMESEIEAFIPSRNDLFLLVCLLLIIVFKFVYIVKIDYIVNTDPRFTNKKFDDLVYCLFDSQCIFETVITFTSLIVDILILSIVFYFLCCDSSMRPAYIKKIKNSNKSIIVKIKCK